MGPVALRLNFAASMICGETVQSISAILENLDPFGGHRTDAGYDGKIARILAPQPELRRQQLPVQDRVILAQHLERTLRD